MSVSAGSAPNPRSSARQPAPEPGRAGPVGRGDTPRLGAALSGEGFVEACAPARVLALAALGVGLLVAAGCQQEMASQPSYKPLSACKFFTDGRSARPPVPGTVARGHLHTDIARFTGRRTRKAAEQQPAVVQPKVAKPVPLAEQYADFVDTFPFPVTAEVLEHGYNRYMIYCVVCHDPLGTGRGKIVERGYTAPPSYHIPRLRQAPVGHLFAVISEGYGSMPSYSGQIPVRDRWAIVAYLRALQMSQHFPEGEVSPDMRQQWSRQDSAAPAPGGETP